MRHIAAGATSSRDLPTNPNHAADPSSTLPYCSTVVRRRIDVGFSHQFLAKGTALSELESAMIDIYLLLELSTDSIAENSAGECNTVSTLNKV